MAGEEGLKAAQKISIDGEAPEDAPGVRRKPGEEVVGVPAGVRDPVAAAQRLPERKEMVGVPVQGPQQQAATGDAKEPAEGTYEAVMSQLVGPPRRIRRRSDDEDAPAWWDQVGYE